MFWLLFLLLFLPPIDGFVCPVYKQNLNDKGKINMYDIPKRIGRIHCDSCSSYKNGSTAQFDCALESDPSISPAV